MHLFNYRVSERFARKKPQRIVSLVPSQTELLYTLGLDREVVAITKFCVHPRQWHKEKQRIGGTKNINLEKILSLEPDLVIANIEENNRAQVEELERSVPVWVTDVTDLDSAIKMIIDIGKITQTSTIAAELCSSIKQRFSLLTGGRQEKLSCAYLIWQDPLMTVGGDTFINDMLNRCGFSNAFAHLERYPEITPELLRDTSCDLLMLSSEPYPFNDAHRTQFQKELKHTKVLLVDGEMFSWYGSRLLEAPAYFARLMITAHTQ